MGVLEALEMGPLDNKRLFFCIHWFCCRVLEHRINEDFCGPRNHQIGTIFWYSFSTMVFAHGERLVSNLARLVVIIWCFVVLQ
ncbi:hypothetical protein C1H46_009226 [Malus baccata]|uniref:Ionotropic glutamate receptor C-terminal domain-containing protein n=1 Tax=Malus baccata TaxID=106549 RepID=A0A540N2F7_MALBA|nr:hypothetical protein C1H46_009226 [Malus baccata]